MSLSVQILHNGVTKILFEGISQDETLLDGTEFLSPTTVIATRLKVEDIEAWSIDVYHGRKDSWRRLPPSVNCVTLCKTRPTASFYPTDNVLLIAEVVE